MATKYLKHGNYREHAEALRRVLAEPGLSQSKLVLLYGTSNALLDGALSALREKALGAGIITSSVEAATITESTLAAMTQQESLFEPATMYILRRSEAAKNLAKLLGSITNTASFCNHLCLVYEGDAPAAALKSVLTKLKATLIPCFVPWPNEVPQVITSLAGSLGLRLSQDAVQLLLAANGEDLGTIQNELRKLTCAFNSQVASQVLTAADLAPHLGLLREEDAVQLERILLQEQWSKAYALADNLLARGEKALPLIAILASHCRTMLRLMEAAARGVAPQAMAGAANVPPFILKTYLPYLKRGAGPERYIRALGLCQEADVLLKSRPLSDDLVVSRVIDALAWA